MRRSAAALVLLALFAAGPRPALAASPAPGATLAVGIDPSTVVGVTMWAIQGLVRIMQLADQLSEHLKEDVRRARDPHFVPPQVFPVPRPDLIEVDPTPMCAPPYGKARPAPITDTLPARSTS